MSFTFKTEVLGAQMEVTGYFDENFFEIEYINHKGVLLDIDGIEDFFLNGVAEDAVKAAAKEASEYAMDRINK